MPEYKRSHLLKYFLLFIGYALVMAAYSWYTSPNQVPAVYSGTAADPATFFTPAQLKDSETLGGLRNWIFFMSGPWEWLIYVLLLSGGLARYWRDSLKRTKLPITIRFPIFVLLVQAASFLLYLPLRITGYSISKTYGISTQPVLSWIRDKLVDFGVGYITVLAVSAVAFWVISRGGRWWFKLWVISIPFIVFMMYIQPVVIDPLYNHYSRLSDPVLEQRILNLAAKAGISADRVYEVDMSKKTNAMNAYVNGIGSSLRIVLWDTTLKQLNEQEILLIMAHEMGHYEMHHLEWSALGAVGSSLVMLTVGGFLYRWLVRRWGAGWGIRSLSDMTALPLLLLLIAVLSFVSLPISNQVASQAESAADAYGMKLIGSAEGAISMHQKLAVASLDDVNPPLLVRWFQGDHPSDLERILTALKFEKEHKQEKAKPDGK
ncbi:peptidase M48 [Paenibacillus baekrokdamisoli]|uniref:Peptidase M48 n=2 Tax=Paenibacillus baekrokdamisoli TaxID=1712516 RepID=A0A3G9JFU9_9BACL|nr:M48 family metallopeptidase [Paenibacillus baekrokdamisoli]BBH22928.1 peptidase M48 [Paenibacillus baekrokdamisoli]